MSGFCSRRAVQKACMRVSAHGHRCARYPPELAPTSISILSARTRLATPAARGTVVPLDTDSKKTGPSHIYAGRRRAGVLPLASLGLPSGAVTHQPPSKPADCLPAPPSYQSCPEWMPAQAVVVRSRPHQEHQTTCSSSVQSACLRWQEPYLYLHAVLQNTALSYALCWPMQRAPYGLELAHQMQRCWPSNAQLSQPASQHSASGSQMVRHQMRRMCFPETSWPGPLVTPTTLLVRRGMQHQIA